MSSNVDFESALKRISELEEKVAHLQNRAKNGSENKVNIICFSGEWDRLFAALTIASGSLAMGCEVHLFFTFWAVSAFKMKKDSNGNSRSFTQNMFVKMLPSGARKTKLSKFNFGGLGKVMMKKEMKKAGIDDIDKLFEEVKELGANIHVCDTSVSLFGIDCNELESVNDSNRCGVATFLAQALNSKMTLFI